MTGNQTGRVTPFGHPRIKGCLLLPEAFRSLPRPSSPDGSKASTTDPFLLDHIISRPLPYYMSKNSFNVEVWGFEPQAYSLQSYRSSQLSYTPNTLFQNK